ncbi:helix-turn-helix domain-containing protein [Falsiroseomonas oryzae]|uniref:helix-turn-helix domain-containing protein n=1 Tax=Falsiroseomonas oryzae TaxID=2766473 RepID=UPI0022EB2C8D|nr:helix-turn-helix domain-containing protein [Roseomonas sp. MO-31]
MPAGATAVQHARFTEPAELLDAMPGVVMQVTPLPHAGFYVDLTTIRLGDVVLVHGSCSPLAMVAVPGAATVALQFPLDGADTMVLNGQLLPPFGFCLYGPGTQLVRSNTQSNSSSVLVMPPEVADAHLGGEEGCPVVRPGEYVLRSAQPESWHRMARLIRSASGIAADAPDVFATEPPRRALRASLLGVAQDLIQQAEEVLAPRSRRTSDDWRRIVLGAEAYLKAHIDRPIYTEELCRTLGISAGRLADAFQGMLGISPHRYLKLRRLNLVRAALRQPDGGPHLVKSIALAHGFWHLGQFSHDYRECFGESPSETLAAAQAGSPVGAAEVAPAPREAAMRAAQGAAGTR